MNESNTMKLMKAEGRGRLLEIHGRPVVHVRGEPFEMGYQHGAMLAEQIHQSIQAYVFEYALEDQEMTLEILEDIFRQTEPFIPKSYMEEMRGISEGSGVSLHEIHLFHILPTLWHCTGCAAMKEATSDGKLYHYRSLDHPLDIGRGIKAQDNSCITVWEPDGAVPHAAPSWIGSLGIVTGINAAGMSMGEMGSHCSDESFEGMPMWFQMREVMGHVENLDDGRRLMEEWQPECGYNFILTDGKVPDAIAIEVTHSKFEWFTTNDPKEDCPPHFPIPNIVRRTNHFVSPELAETQREVYDPAEEMEGSALFYQKLSEFVQHLYGKLDAEKMIWICHQYPKEHHCLHQAVFCPVDGDFWVSNAVNPDTCETPGAQNQEFLPYNLQAILEFEE